MPVNAASRGRQGKRQGMMGDDADTQSFGQLGHSIRSAFDQSTEQVGDDVGMTPEIRASKERSAELLRDASDLVAERTNDS